MFKSAWNSCSVCFFCSSRPHYTVFLGGTQGSEKVVCPLHHPGGFHTTKSDLRRWSQKLKCWFCLLFYQAVTLSLQGFLNSMVYAWGRPNFTEAVLGEKVPLTPRMPFFDESLRSHCWRRTCPHLLLCCDTCYGRKKRQSAQFTAVKTGRFQQTEEKRHKRMKEDQRFMTFSTKAKHYQRFCLLWILIESQEFCQNDLTWWILNLHFIDGLFGQILQRCQIMLMYVSFSNLLLLTNDCNVMQVSNVFRY